MNSKRVKKILGMVLLVMVALFAGLANPQTAAAKSVSYHKTSSVPKAFRRNWYHYDKSSKYVCRDKFSKNHITSRSKVNGHVGSYTAKLSIRKNSYGFYKTQEYGWDSQTYPDNWIVVKNWKVNGKKQTVLMHILFEYAHIYTKKPIKKDLYVKVYNHKSVFKNIGSYYTMNQWLAKF